MQVSTRNAGFWLTLKSEAQHIADNEPLLASYIHACILTIIILSLH